jgi:hypothetical protein
MEAINSHTGITRIFKEIERRIFVMNSIVLVTLLFIIEILAYLSVILGAIEIPGC